MITEAPYGFGGMRDDAGEVAFHPRLPTGWTMLRFRLTIRGNAVHVQVHENGTTYTLHAGEGVTIGHEDEALQLTPQVPAITRPNARTTDMEASSPS